ncbi:MAG: hypothetical protein JWN30_1498 [Bacilli bacterium]|nr:hypothetical protein [Bacilli bacterium]
MFPEHKHSKPGFLIPAFTLLELMFAIVISVMVMGISVRMFAFAVSGYREALSERMTAASLSVVNHLISGDIHAAARVSANYGGLLSISKATAQTVSYSLNLNGHLIRQVNGVGGEIVADNVHSFSVAQGVYAGEIQIQIGFKLPNKEETWSLLFSAGHD